MAHINLLPWREAAAQAEQKEYFTLLAAIGVITLAFVLHLIFIIRRVSMGKVLRINT